MMIPELKAHDLLWVKKITGEMPDWYHHDSKRPVVIRRDSHLKGIPVGIRGEERYMRSAVWTNAQYIIRHQSACDIAQKKGWELQYLKHPLQQLKTLVLVNDLFTQYQLLWGIGGSLGYELATGKITANDKSDIDLILYLPEKPHVQLLTDIWQQLQQFPFKTDVQIETKNGAVALYEIIQGSNLVMLKTNEGPLLVNDPWIR